MRGPTPPPTESSRGGVCDVAQSLSLNVCIICGASINAQRCACVRESDRTKYGVSSTVQGCACDRKTKNGTHFIIQSTTKRATSYWKGTRSGKATCLTSRASTSHPPFRVDVDSSWEPSPLSTSGLGYTPEEIEKAIERLYSKCRAAKDVHQPQRRRNPPEAPQQKVSSNFRSKRLANRQVRTGRHRARLRNQGTRKPTNLQAAIDQTTTKL